jgi:carbonic anhydrase
MEQSMILRDMILKGEVGIIGALYDVETGIVTFLDHTQVLGADSLYEQELVAAS